MTGIGSARRRAELEARDPEFLERVRNAADRLGVARSSGDVVADALAEVEELATMEADVPVESRSFVARAVKVVVKRLSGWYLGYLASQITALGEAITRLGYALADKTARIEKSNSDLVGRVEAIERRLDRLGKDPT